MIRLLINGIHGQMGHALCKAAEESDSFTVSGGVDRVVDAAFPYPIFPDYPSVNVPYDVIIDFSVPA
nr:4-hydroxy-tetrahydrodipicolinate reductase [Clostridiales bacterium]